MKSLAEHIDNGVWKDVRYSMKITDIAFEQVNQGIHINPQLSPIKSKTQEVVHNLFTRKYKRNH